MGPHVDNVKEEATRLRQIFSERKQEAKANGERFTQATIAEMCGWSGQSAVSQYMTGRLELNLDALLKLSRAMRFNPNEVSPRLMRHIPALLSDDGYGEGDDARESYSIGFMTPQMPKRPRKDRIPLVKLATITPEFIADRRFHTNTWITSPGPAGARSFAFINEGISMEPQFGDADQIVVDPDLDQNAGDFVLAAQVQPWRCVFRQLKHEGGEKYLAAINPSFEPRYIRLDENWLIIGRARWKITDL